MCKRVASPVAERVLNLARAGEWTKLQKLRIVPTDYADPYSYWADASCVDLVRKMALPGSGTAQAAVDKFLETERICCSVNQRMRSITENYGLAVSDMAFIDRLDRWKEKIRVVLGRVPEYLEPSFSGGSTTSTRKLESTIFDKLSMTPERYSHSTETVDFLFYQSRWGDVAHERRLYPRVATANEYFTVPKNGLTDRSCCMESVLNLSFQLAVGKVLRKRAFKVLNIDLNHGADLHRLLALQGSIYGGIATLDLSSASDRWARELVRYLLPFEWRDLLDSLRATHTSFGGKRLYLEKYSSMGNGFTFELETILFATLAHVVAADEGLVNAEIHCFGDDLIVPEAMAVSLGAALASVGHQLNMEKSFMEGSFRESCGGDYHSGEAVSTAKLEKLPEEPSDWIAFANNLRRVSGGRQRYWGLVLPVWKKVLSYLPNQIKDMRGPTYLGDTVIHDKESEWRVTRGRVKAWCPVVLERELSYYNTVPLARILGAIRTRGATETVSLPKVTGYKSKSVPIAGGSLWLPTDRFRRIDPRLTSLRKLYGDRELEAKVF